MKKYTDKDMLAFAKITTEGSYGDFRGCKTIESKLERYNKIQDSNSRVQETPVLNFAIHEVDAYKKKWYNMRSKIDALLNGEESMSDLDSNTLKTVLEIMNIIDNNETKEYDYNIPRYLHSDENLEITHEQISELFNKER